MKIARRFDVKYSYLFLTVFPMQDSFAALTLQCGPGGSYKDVVDWLPSEGLLEETMKAACLLLGSIVQGCACQLFQRAKGWKVQGHHVWQKGATSQGMARKLASAAQGHLTHLQASGLTWTAGWRSGGLIALGPSIHSHCLALCRAALEGLTATAPHGTAQPRKCLFFCNQSLLTPEWAIRNLVSSTTEAEVETNIVSQL